jgi:hypothetical protein
VTAVDRILEALFARLIDALDTIGVMTPEDEREAQQKEATEQ